jgi:hypothetical protein
METCKQCKFYKPGLFTKPTCTRIPNIALRSAKVSYFEIPAAFKICKWYFFEHKDSDLYKTKDDSLSGESFFSEDTINEKHTP